MNRPVIGLVGRQPIVSLSVPVCWSVVHQCIAEQKKVEVSVSMTPTTYLASLQYPLSKSMC